MKSAYVFVYFWIIATINIFGQEVILERILTGSIAPTEYPSDWPSVAPSVLPSFPPSIDPTQEPTTNPTASPSQSPTTGPTTFPTDSPTAAPSVFPTVSPTAPTFDPTLMPSATPSEWPTDEPSESPTELPTNEPSEWPTIKPTATPTSRPSRPTKSPTITPTTSNPTVNPTQPTRNPSKRPTVEPTKATTTSDPVLSSFDLDCNIGKLTLHFEDLVAAWTLDPTGIGFQTAESIGLAVNHTVNTTNAIYLTRTYNNVSSQGNTTDLEVYLTSDDFARLKLNTRIATELSSAYLTLRRGTVYSPFGHENTAILYTDAMQATLYKADASPPYLAYYTLDMNDAQISITFSEPVDATSFTLYGIALQASKYVKVSTEAKYFQLLEYKHGLLSSSNYNRTIIYALGMANVNLIKGVLGLAISPETSYLSVYEPFVNDLSGNAVSTVGIDNLHGIKARIFYPDTTSPRLKYWEFDINLGTIMLTFSESVYNSFLNYSAVVLTNGVEGVQVNYTELRVEAPINRSLANSDRISFNLNFDQWNRAKATKNFLKSADNTYLVLEKGFVVDTSKEQNEYEGLDATYSNPMQAIRFGDDITPPIVYYYTINMQLRTLTIVMTEAIRIDTINFNALTLQSDNILQLETESLLLSPDMVTLRTTKDSPIIEIYFNPHTFSTLKAFKKLAKSKRTTYLVVTRAFVMDEADIPNPVSAIFAYNAMQVYQYTPDSVQPTVSSWSADFSLSQIVIEFSKPINASSVRTSAMSLSSDAVVIESTVEVYLTPTSYVLSSDLNFLTIQLSVSDANIMKSYGTMCISADTCYLNIYSNFARDIATFDDNGRAVQEQVSVVTLLPTTNFTADSIAPQLFNYTINMNKRSVALLFSEPVTSQTINSSGIMFNFNTTSGSVSEVQLTRFGYSLDFNKVQLELFLCNYDYLQLQAAQPFRISETSLTMETFTIADTNGNDLSDTYATAGGGGNALLPSHIIEDTTSPSLIAINVESSKKFVTLYFSERIELSSIELANFYFISTSGVKQSLTNAEMNTTANAQAIRLDISSMLSSLNTAGLVTSQDTTYFYISAGGSYTDASPAKNAGGGMAAASAIRDGLTVLSFRLDMDRQILSLELPYEADIRTVNMEYFTLTSANKQTMYALTGYDNYELVSSGLMLEITLTDTDFIYISKKFTLTDESSISLTLDTNAIVDMNNKPLSARKTLPCSYLVADTSALYVSYYNLNLVTGILTLEFSKEVVVSSISLIGTMSLQDTASDPTQTLLLSNLIVTSTTAAETYTTTIEVSLNGVVDKISGRTMREEVLLNYPLAASKAMTYLSIRKGLAFDRSSPPNPSAAITTEDALQVTTYQYDDEPPALLYYTIDMTKRYLSLTFTEAVNASSCRPGHFTLLEDPDDITSRSYQLQSSELLSDGFVHTVIITLSAEDIDAMMRMAPHLALTRGTTNLAFLPNAVHDVANPANKIKVNFFRYGEPVFEFVPDSVAPQLVNYSLSIPDRTLDLLFDEVVNCSSVNVEAIVFQYQRFTGKSPLKLALSKLSTPDCSVLDYDTNVHINVGLEDILSYKSYKKLIKKEEYVWLRLLPTAFSDMSGNSVTETIDGYAHAPSVFIPDTTSPHLLSFLVSAQNILTLVFDEPIDKDSINVKEITMMNDIPTNTKSYRLSAAKLFRVDVLCMRFEFHMLGDYYRVDGDSNIFDSQWTTYLSATELAFADTSGNRLVAINTSEALQLGPSIDYWDLNLNTGQIVLNFTEYVNKSFSLVGVTIQGAYDFSNISIALGDLGDSSNDTAAVVETMTPLTGDATSVSFSSYLTNADLNNFKLSELLQQGDRLFLTAVYNLTQSLNEGDVIPYLKTVQVRPTTARRVRKYTPDSTPPLCLTFDLDLNEGTLRIEFNEPMDADTVDLTGFTVLSSANGTFADLTNGEQNIELVHERYLLVTLSTYDLNNVKLAYCNGGILDNLVITEGSVKDLLGNSFEGNNADTPILISSFVADTTPPVFTSWTLDLSSYIITLEFDEFVAIDSLLPSNIYVQAHNETTLVNQQYQLTDYSMLQQGSALNIVLLDLGFMQADQFALEAQQIIATNISNSFLQLLTVSDIFGNTAADPQTLSVSTINENKHYVELLAFDMSSVSVPSSNSAATVSNLTLTMYFNHYMFVENFTCADFALRSSESDTSTAAVQLAQPDCKVLTRDNNHKILLNISEDLFGSVIGSSADTTFLYLPAVGYTRDIYGNRLASKTSDNALRVGPQVIDAALEMNSGEMIVVFSKPINFSTLHNVSNFGVYSSVTGAHYFLDYQTGVTTLAPYAGTDTDTVGVVSFSGDDLDHVKTLDIRNTRTFLLLQPDTLYDKDEVSVDARISAARRLPISRITADNQAPRIVSMSLDMGKEQLTIIFDEPVRRESVKATNFRILSERSIENATFYRLTGGTASTNLRNLTIQLTQHDAGVLKLTPNLAKNISNSYVAVEYRSVADFAGNYLENIPTDEARQVDSFVEDTVNPRLLSFKLDMSSAVHTGILTLYFSEPVQASQMSLLNITLQSRFTARDGVKFTLTGGVINSQDADTVEILLLAEDVISMKLLNGLVRRKQSSYLVASANVAYDLMGNELIPWEDGEALACTTYVKDLVPPVIEATEINLDAGTITFFMNEPIILGTVEPRGLTVQLEQISAKYSYTLTNKVSYVDASILPLSETVVIQLGAADLDALKYRYPLATSKANTWFSIASVLMTDFSGNPPAVVSGSKPIQVTTYINDTTRPVMSKMTLDMNRGAIDMTFSESISADSIDVAQLTMQTVQTRRYGNSIQLNATSFTAGTGAQSIYLTINIDDRTLNYMKRFGMGYDLLSSYLAWSDRFVADNSGNYLYPFWDSSVYGFAPRVPDTLVVDSGKPSLVRWYIDRSTMTLRLFFNEPIRLTLPTNITVYRHSDSDKNTDVRNTLSRARLITPPTPSGPPPFSYRELNLQVVMPLHNYCLEADCDLTAISGGKNLFSFLNDSSFSYLLVLEDAASVVDFAKIPNTMNQIYESAAMKEGGPDCSLCPLGQYTSQNCTTSSDRQCSPCSSCIYGTYMRESCTAYHDTGCATCSDCPYGKYIAQSCSRYGSTDTVCATCSTCSAMEYPSRACALGLDTICETCKTCTFSDATAEAICKTGLYYSWYSANCCVDSAGAQVDCKEQTLKMIVDQSLSGRHNWVFDGVTAPKLPQDSKYAFGKTY